MQSPQGKKTLTRMTGLYQETQLLKTRKAAKAEKIAQTHAEETLEREEIIKKKILDDNAGYEKTLALLDPTETDLDRAMRLKHAAQFTFNVITKERDVVQVNLANLADLGDMPTNNDFISLWLQKFNYQEDK